MNKNVQMKADRIQFAIIDKETGKEKVLGTAGNQSFSFTIPNTPENTKSLRWLLGQPLRIKKYIKQILSSTNLNNERNRLCNL